MIDARLSASVQQFASDVAAAKPIATLTPLQLASLVARGRQLVDALDAWLISVAAPLDAPDPTGHPLVMIADIRGRLAAAQDATTLADLRGLLGRAVLNLSESVA